MATIETKYVDVGFFDGSPLFPNQYGFNGPLNEGTLSNTANGASDPDVSGIYSGVDCLQVVWFSTNSLSFQVEGVQSNSGWDSITIGSTTLNRSAAGFTTNSTGNGSSLWTWSSVSNPFGTTEGADVLVTWDDGVSATPPDIDVTETSAREITPGATSYTMSFNNATNGDQYQLRHYDAGAQTGTIVNSTPATAASGAFSIALASTDLPASGTADTKWYSLYARRPTANGGDNQYDYCNGTTLVNTLNLTRRPLNPTITISDDDAASANVGIIATISDSNTFTADRLVLVQYTGASAGSPDSQVTALRTDYTGAGTYSGDFTQPRNTGTDNYFYRAYLQKLGTGSTPQAELTGSSFSDYDPSNGGDYQPGYIAPDPAVSPVSTTITSVATSASIVINNVTSGEEYQLRNLTGQVQYQSGVASGTSVTISQTGGLPTAGNTVTYSVYARRPENIGGDNNYDATGDTYTITRSDAPSGSISFTSATSATEGGGSLGFTFTNTIDGTYFYDVNRISGSVGTGEITNPGPASFTVSGGTGTVDINFINDSVTEIGFQGEEFVMRYGTTSNSEDLDTLNFTLYDDDSGVSYSDSTINIGVNETDHDVSIVRQTGDSSTNVNARIRNVTTNTVIGSVFSLSTGTTVRAVADAPAEGDTETFRVEVFNGNEYINGPSYTVTRADIVAPTASSVTFNNPSSPNVTATVNLSNTGNGGTLQYACELNNTTPTNWQASNTFTISRGSSGTVYARARTSTTAVSNTVNAARPGFLIGDTDVTPADVLITSGAANATVSVSNVTSGETYAVRAVDGSTNFATATATSTGVSIGPFTNNLPAEGAQTTYEIYVRRPTGTGGDGSTFADTNDQFTVTRQSSSGGGGGGGGVGTPPTYGIQVLNSTGQEIWGTSQRSTNVVKAGSASVPAPTSNPYAPGTVTITGVEDMTSTNTDVMEVVLIGGNAQSYSVSRGTNQFTISNFLGSAGTVGYIVVRFG